MAASYENTPRHNFICIQANKFCLTHESMAYKNINTIVLAINICDLFYLDHSTSGSDILIPKEVVCRKNNSLKRVLYKTPDSMDFKERSSLSKPDMLTVVVEISVYNHIKVNII